MATDQHRIAVKRRWGFEWHFVFGFPGCARGERPWAVMLDAFGVMRQIQGGTRCTRLGWARLGRPVAAARDGRRHPLASD